jgi:hypothetical protein
LFAVCTDNGRGWSEANADGAVRIDIRAFGGNAADNILGSHGFGWRFIGHWRKPRWALRFDRGNGKFDGIACATPSKRRT